MPGEYPSLRAFYEASQLRRRSRKADYGVRWLTRPAAALLRPPPWRVTYLRETREVIATPLAGDGPVEVLAVVPPLPFPAGWLAAPDRLLAGWDEPELTGWQLSWVRARLAPPRAWVP